ncbi:hypothetical protein SAMN06298221_11039 [Sphaerochaeta associata]|uniref:Uncharacterized protein n=1 Tax=Sphaerochaeta associata TaxID=1129264 RepID=A0ABY4DCF9_9SPIR|nr:hypothetical protein [Sphaerochaeta associata]UOM51948.1 hypothetical protein MUG09_04050 [Sphaerochaeta associata]SMP58320.1 hypothetical protein SAMN06298221_11039 [Sphaerochaeta associata]
MKKIAIILLVALAAVSGPLFAADQILRAGMWAEVSDLLDIRTPSEFVYVGKPYAEYLFGRQSTDNLTGGTYLSTYVPYEFGSELSAVRPYGASWLDFRFNEKQNQLMQTGLYLSSSQDDSYGSFLTADAYFTWYPYNKAKEVTVHQHFRDLVKGLRLGVDIGGGVFVSQLFEDAAIATDLNVGISGILESGAQLSDHLWVQGYVLLGFPTISMPSTFDTFEVSASNQFMGSLAYISEKLKLVTEFSASITADKLWTQNGFSDGSGLNYSYMARGEAGYYFTEDLFAYVGAELYGSKASLLGSSNAYIGVHYFLL